MIKNVKLMASFQSADENDSPQRLSRDKMMNRQVTCPSKARESMEERSVAKHKGQEQEDLRWTTGWECVPDTTVHTHPHKQFHFIY